MEMKLPDDVHSVHIGRAITFKGQLVTVRLTHPEGLHSGSNITGTANSFADAYAIALAQRERLNAIVPEVANV